VMLGYMLTTLGESAGAQWTIRTAGTHVTEGSAMSSRTRDALKKIEGLGEHRYGAHRSHQLDASDCAWADVLLAAEADNVFFVRTNFSQFADEAVQLAAFVHFASSVGDFASQLRAASHSEPSKAFDVTDPAGGDQATYDACARQLWVLAQTFANIVGDERVS